jgi:hypothetical protein
VTQILTLPIVSIEVVSPSGTWRNASSLQSGQIFFGITPCPGVEPGTRRRGWRSKPVGSPFPRHGTLSRRGFEPRSCAPKAQIVVRWTIGSRVLPSVRQLIIYLYDCFRLRNHERVVVIVRLIAGAYFGCSREYHTGSCRLQTLLGPASWERSS